jgi:OmpA-OmpF porin, OOP family
MRNLGIILILIAWALLGRWMCTCYCAECCVKEPEKAISVAPVPVVETNTAVCPNGPICFARNSCEPIFGTSFNAMRDSLIATVGSGQNLRIIGTYGSDETYSGEYENLGLCRANAIKSEIAKVFDPERIDAGAQLNVGQSSISEDLSTDRISFSVVDEAAPIPMSTLIYFPFNSTDKLNDNTIEAYLDSVAERVKGSGEKVQLTGHTDDIGSAASNERLARKRAVVIKDYLTSKGVQSAKIIVDSKGETQPVATNSTEDGRAKNRRTELQIIN